MLVLDFGVLPPEINSGRMYAGPGAGPMMAAAAAWGALATELFSTATGYQSVLCELADGWRGPASLSMTKAAAPYVAWLHDTAAAAEQTAAQAKVAAAAYELAFAMTVPPPVIAANRSLLLALIATNFFGQNTPAIAATEAHYAEMWIQDATAMYGYAGSSAAASRLTPFTEPRHTADPAGLAAQSGAVGHAAGNAVAAQSATSSQLLSTAPTAPTALQQLGAPIAGISPQALVALVEHVPNVTNSVLSSNNAVASGRGIWAVNARLAFQDAQDLETSTAFGGRLLSATPACLGGSPVSAGMGRATLVGKLSVPTSWVSAAPEIQPVALTLPTSGTVPAEASADLPLASGGVFSQSVLGTLSRDGPDTPRHKSKPIIVRSPSAG